LIYECNYPLPNLLTSLTQIFNLSNSQTVPENPSRHGVRRDLGKLKAVEAFRFPRKGFSRPALPLNHPGQTTTNPVANITT
jgi:hypothetical protein